MYFILFFVSLIYKRIIPIYLFPITSTKDLKHDEIVIAVVACNQRLSETLNMIKSAILFNYDNAPLKFIVIAETELIKSFEEKLEDWQEVMKNTFTYAVLPLTFPELNRNEWRNLFKPCAAQRLFLPVC